VELAVAFSEMHDLADALCQDGSMAEMPAAAAGDGLGRIEAARGCLVHRVELREGRVARYQILAPTEWNFHPDGALVRGLAGRAAGDDAAWRARLLVAALDPCVTYTLRIL
jgi:coenzyme F420-reducing hydrogenase alpha subunit